MGTRTVPRLRLIKAARAAFKELRENVPRLVERLRWNVEHSDTASRLNMAMDMNEAADALEALTGDNNDST